VLSQRDFTLEAPSKPARFAAVCRTWQRAPLESPSPELGRSLRERVHFLPFLFFHVFLGFFFCSPALTSSADSFRIKCPQLVPMLSSNRRKTLPILLWFLKKIQAK